MQTYLLADPTRYPHMTTAQLRETFLMDSLYEPGALHLVYVDLDRTIVGIAAPVWEPVALPADAETLDHCRPPGSGRVHGCRRSRDGLTPG